MSELSPKDPDVAAEYSIDWYDELVDEAARDTAFEEGELARAQRETGWVYECTTPGRTSAHWPTQWARAEGQTTQDGSLVWTARHPDTAATAGIQSVSWEVPSGLTFDSQREVGAVAFVTVSGGTDGVDYDVLCRLTPTVGDVIEKTITIPVRSQ